MIRPDAAGYVLEVWNPRAFRWEGTFTTQALAEVLDGAGLVLRGNVSPWQAECSGSHPIERPPGDPHGHCAAFLELEQRVAKLEGKP